LIKQLLVFRDMTNRHDFAIKRAYSRRPISLIKRLRPRFELDVKIETIKQKNPLYQRILIGL